MRTVKIQGGLGNQLFGLAFAHSIADLTGERVALDLAAYDTDRYERRFLLADLVTRLRVMDAVRRPWLASRATRTAMRVLAFPGWIAEGARPVDVKALGALARRGRYFSGYWQNEVYISQPREVRQKVREFLLAQAGEVASHQIVVHYRTYKEEIRPSRRSAPTQAYFAAALERLRARGLDVLLVSDDPELALQNLGALGRGMAVADSRDPWTGMALLLRARNLILCNSSFSWWGGFCGQAATIVYPTRAGLFHYPTPSRGFEVI